VSCGGHRLPGNTVNGWAGGAWPALGRWLGVAIASTLVCACASVSPPGPSGGESISGRLALRVEAQGGEPARAFSATFDLRGSPSSGALGLTTPLGSTIAQARWQPGEVVLATPQGSRRFADLDAMTRDLLGESVPVEAWFDWLRGHPWPQVPSTASEPAGFDQLGWSVDVSGLADGSVLATRRQPPVVTVRIRLDRP